MRIRRPPRSMMFFIVGIACTMRRSSVIVSPSKGTLKSARIRTRLPLTSMSAIVCFCGIGSFPGSLFCSGDACVAVDAQHRILTSNQQFRYDRDAGVASTGTGRLARSFAHSNKKPGRCEGRASCLNQISGSGTLDHFTDRLGLDDHLVFIEQVEALNQKLMA